MIPGTFDYHAPNSVDEAIKLLSSLGDEAKLLPAATVCCL